METINNFARSLRAIMIISLVTCSVTFAQTTYNISTIAGTGTSGNAVITDSLKAQFNAPNGVDVDSQGNIYVCDLTNKLVRKIEAGTNNISTIAGNGKTGILTSGMLATEAPLGVPGALAVAPNGDVYIAESDSGRVLRVDATDHKIYVFAGTDDPNPPATGKATDTKLTKPIALALDSQDNVYIVDRVGIVYIVLSNDDIRVFAGSGTSTAENILATNARLDFPVGIAIDASNKVYIADRLRNRVLVVENEFISTFTVNATLSGPRQVAVDANNNVYISDMGNQRILQVTSGGTTTTFAGGGSTFQDGVAPTATTLNNPRDIAIDIDGSLLIADRQHHRIRRVKNNIINTVVGSGVAGFSNGVLALGSQLNEPGGVSLDGNGNLYVADVQNHRIRKIDLNSGIISNVAGTGQAGHFGDNDLATCAKLNSPGGVTVAPNGDIYIADSHNNRVRRIEASTGIIRAFAGDGNTNDVGVGDDSLAVDAQLKTPIGIAIDNNGNVYIADRDQSRIRRVRNDTITTIAGNGTAGFNGDNILASNAHLNNAVGIAVDANGVIYIGDRNNLIVRKIENDTIKIIAGGSIQEGGGAPNIGRPRQVAVDAAGNVFFADLDSNRIRRIDAVTGAVTTVAGGGNDAEGEDILATNAELDQPRDIAIAADGKIYIADRGDHRIRVLIPNTGSRITRSEITVTETNPTLVYPNPASQKVTIRNNAAEQIVLINMQGKQLHQANTTKGEAQLSLEALKSGIYFIRVLDAQGKLINTKTLVINR
ncbi:MAG TPA: hypothetical protein DCS93_09060 [Microscillaceae bacterium]|nr:hypothetical protein [Microscillaceae bacterium]